MSKEPKEEIIKENETDTETAALDLIRPNHFDIRNFHKEFTDHSEEVLKALLNLQSNDNPLKKGGPDIGYKVDLLILKNKQLYTTKENDLFDVLSG